MSLNLPKPFSLNVLKIFRGYTMIETNTMPIFNTDTTILLKLCPFLWFFCFSIKKFVQSKKTCPYKVIYKMDIYRVDIYEPDISKMDIYKLDI